ncbi:MAG: fumarylacetoacetate hydrolase family protein [Gammaproteobacteria bacterium]|nr:fumarylacetoacetate hydrolase family protein [Gammaproteobacteria bacterium]MBI5615021.1 fumarylacetoacetate hydrolase family protein [Gammaproteobacteria bacterium]
MKLATLESSTRDGMLAVVSRDLTRMLRVPAIAPTLQAALDDWARCEPLLRQVAAALERNACDDARIFEPVSCAAPLPRAYQWVDGSAYVNHVELVRKARGAEMPASFWHDPLVYQGGSDDLLGPCAPIVVASEEFGIDLEAEVAVVTGDVPMGTRAEEAGRYIRLVMLVNDVSLRNLVPGELAKGFGFYQSKPASAFSPVAVTPDELGDAWDGGKVLLPLRAEVNGELLGAPECGVDMTFDFTQLIAHAARTRRLGAGTIVGSGTVSNYDRSRGSACLAERRMLETLEHGAARTPFLRYGDRLKIEMYDAAGRSIFGAIEQMVLNPDDVR